MECDRLHVQSKGFVINVAVFKGLFSTVVSPGDLDCSIYFPQVSPSSLTCGPLWNTLLDPWPRGNVPVFRVEKAQHLFTVMSNPTVYAVCRPELTKRRDFCVFKDMDPSALSFQFQLPCLPPATMLSLQL
ncbi:hypothetical protein STEG23_010683 [Scotinomys teguina]